MELERLALYIEDLKNDQYKHFDIRDIHPEVFAPATLVNLLKRLGWEKCGSIKPNGWEGTTEITLSNENYGFDLIVYYSGYYGELCLYRDDIDD